MDLHAKLMHADADIRDLANSLDEESGCTWFAVDITSGDITQVAYPDARTAMHVALRRRPPSTARWKPFLSGLGMSLSTEGGGDSESALIVVRTSTDPARILIWCFGAASLVVPNALVDGRFGLIVALNKHSAGSAINSWRDLPDTARRRRRMGDPASAVRQVNADVRDGHRHTLVAKSSAASPVQGLGFNSVSDILRALRVLTQDDLMPDLEGGRGLRFATYLDGWTDFATLADHLVILRRRTDYQRLWDWVDHIVPVAPRTEVERLLDCLYRMIVNDENAAVDLVVPELDGEDDHPTRRLVFGMGREQTISAPVAWQHIRRRLVNLPLSATSPLRRQLHLKPDGAPESAKQSFPLLDLLVAEFNEGDHQYLLSDGELLRVDVDFIGRLDAALARIPWSPFDFPTYTGGNEPDYLSTAEQRSGRRLAKLDGRNVELPGQTPFEPCDLFTEDSRLVFAKLKGRSSTFSHLCTQAEAAAEMFLRHGAARDALLDKISACRTTNMIEAAATDAMAALEDRRADTVTVTLLLLGAWRRRDVTTLPLVSRLRLRRTADHITDLGYRFEIASPDLDLTAMRPRT